MDLDQLLEKVCIDSVDYVSNWHFSFLLMYCTGCRHEEINPKYWRIVDSEHYELDCRKHSEKRIIRRSTIPIEICEAIDSGNSDYFSLSRSTLTRAFMRLSFPYRVMYRSDNVFLHSFRYNFLKKLYVENGNFESCRLEIGHKNITNTMIYILKPLTILEL